MQGPRASHSCTAPSKFSQREKLERELRKTQSTHTSYVFVTPTIRSIVRRTSAPRKKCCSEASSPPVLGIVMVIATSQVLPRGAPEPGTRVPSRLNHGGCTAQALGLGQNRRASSALCIRQTQPTCTEGAACTAGPARQFGRAHGGRARGRGSPGVPGPEAAPGPRRRLPGARAPFSSAPPRRPHLGPPQVTRRPQLR